MRITSTLALAVALTASTALAPRQATATGETIYVAPFAPLYHQVPLDLGVRTAGLVQKELEEQQRLVPVEGPEVRGVARAVEAELTPAARAQALRRAENLIAQGREQASALRFDQAATHFRSALRELEENIVYLTDFGLFTAIHKELAIALFRANRQEEAEGYFADVVRYDPEVTLAGEEYPPALTRFFDEVRNRSLRMSRGTLSVMTVPPGADVTFNGRDVGSAPIRLTEVLPGRHHLRVQPPGVPPTVKWVEVRAGQDAREELSFGATIEGDVADVLSALVDNRIDQSAIRQAQQVGRSIGASYVLLGLLQRTPRDFVLRTYLLQVGSGHLARLSDRRIDRDFLGAAIEVFRLSEEIVASVANLPEPLSVPLTVFDGASQTAISFTDVVSAPPAPREAAPAPTPETTARAPERARPAGPMAPVAPVTPAEPRRPDAPLAPVEPTEAAIPEVPARPEPTVEPTRPEPARPVAPPAEPERVERPREERRDDRGDRRPARVLVPPAEQAEAAPDRRPFGPVVDETPEAPDGELPWDFEFQPKSKSKGGAAVGGARGRVMDPEADARPHRFSAFDIDEVVILEEDRERPRRGWPWWMWGLTAAGAVGLGAGGWYAATELGGSASSATVTVEW